jgi:hypothetical protein
MALPTYSTGTASVAAGGTVVTGAGGVWTGINAKQGDFISIGGSAAVLITEVTDTTHLKIAPWPGAAQSGAAYVIYQNYVGRVVGVAAAEDVGVMLEKLHTDGLPFVLGPGETEPDPSYGDDGQFAYDPATNTWWIKTGGVWVLHETGDGSSATFLTVSGSDPAVAPELNTEAGIEIINTDIAGGVGSQIQFGAVEGSPFAMISSRVVSGPPPCVGSLTFSMRENTGDANLTDRLYLTRYGMLSSTNLPGVNEGEHHANFSAYNQFGAVGYYAYTETLNYIGGVTTTPFYGVAENNTVSPAPLVGVWGGYFEGRGGNSFLAWGAEIDVQNTSGLDPKLVTPYDLIGTGPGPTSFAMLSQAAGSKSVTTPKDASAWLVLSTETATHPPNSANVRYWKGIVFNDTSLRAVSGHYEAINFPSNYEIAWYSGGSNIGRLSSDGSALVWSGATFNLGGLDRTPRERLIADRTYYVRTDGNDGNNGLANTAGGAFLTIQHAYDVLKSSLDTSGFNVTIQVGNGTYANGVVIGSSWGGGGQLIIEGNVTTPASVFISKSTAEHIFDIQAPLLAKMTIKGFKCLTTGAGRSHINLAAPGTIQLEAMEFAGVPAGTYVAAINLSAPGAKILLAGPTAISGSMPAWISAVAPGSYVQAYAHTVTLSNAPVWDWVGANAGRMAYVLLANLTFSGAATGSRYSSIEGSIIHTGGGGASYLPGSTAGSVGTGGQYL